MKCAELHQSCSYFLSVFNSIIFVQKKMAVESALLVTIGTSLASGLLKSLLKKSADALSKSNSAAGLKSAILGNLEPKLVNLDRELKKLNALLCSAASAENLMQHNDNNPVLLWLQSVREAANFADDLLDDISYDQLRRQVESNMVANLFNGSDGTSFELRRKIGSKLSNMVSNLFSGSDGTSFKFRREIGSKLHEFQSMTAEIYKVAAEFGISAADLMVNPTSYRPPAAMSTDLREIRENVYTSLVVGRQPDEDLIVQKLSLPDNQVFGVIAIHGMSGVGKTTLARKIYDNETVTNNYKHKAWIFVSRDFNLTRLLDEMLQSLTGVSHSLSNTDAMVKKLRGCLQGERYLLVLDDVWNTDRQVWNSLRSLLDRVTDGCKGSMVLVTTQSSEVASVMGDYTHTVKVLSNDDALVLFEGKALANKSPQQVLELKGIGERILRRCGGLPLAINTLASLLAPMNEKSQWESVDRSWEMSEGQTKIMPWLLLSFNHLPSAAIKQCFAHCSIMILKGRNIHEGNLISSWVAQGFIQLSETSYQDMVAIGRSYITSMLDNGLLQSYHHGNARLISMHDLIHDLAVYVSGDKYLIIRGPNDQASSEVEHVAIYGGNTSNSQLNFPAGNTRSMPRTLICSHTTISIDLVVQARFLRHLELIDCGLKEIPRSIGRLKHLRFLQLDNSSIKYLPESIGSLYHLQVLVLLRCHMLVDLPQQVTKLLNLRVISIAEAVHIPKGLGQLARLMQLPAIKLKAHDGCRIKELGSLKHLMGTITIRQLENIRSKEDVVEAGLKNKEGIEGMKLIWTSEEHGDSIVCSNDEDVMEGLQPHSNLKGLLMENFRGKRFSLWLSNELYFKKLKDIALLNCKRCEQLPTLGGLPNLTTLRLEGMDSVEVIGSDFFYKCDQRVAARSSTESALFPQLKQFQLSNMPRLKEWFDPSGPCASAFPLLEVLDIANCPSLVSVPTCFHSLKQLTMKGINSGEPLLLILSNSYNLTSLTVENVQQLTCLSEPLMKCTRLRLLKIIDCNELVELPPTLQSLGCLETLWVKECDSLKSIPGIEGLLSLSDLSFVRCKSITDAPCGLESCASIEHLSLVQCPELKVIPDLASLSRLRLLQISSFSEQMTVPRWLNHLSNLSVLRIGDFSNELDNFCGIDQLPKCLKELTLYGWQKLKSIPSELQSLTRLEILCLWGFEGVIALPEWMGSLFSLQVLEIRYCENMKQLPSSDVMRSLTRLRKLKITGCPELEERCSKDGGEEWPKISHLPSILINVEKLAAQAVLVAIGTSLASALLKAVMKKSVDALSKANSAADLKSAILGNLKPKLVNLERELRKLDAFLCCAENLNPAQHNGNNPVLPWIRSVREAANFADNLLDDISYNQLRRQAESNKVGDLFSGSDGTSFEFRGKIGSKLSEFRSMTAKIYKAAADIGLSPVDLLANPTSYQPPAAMSTDLTEIRENVDTSLVVGRQPDEDLIVRKLSLPDNQDLGVIAIFGMSGVGKTTLARKIYDNETVTENYKQKTWIFVSWDFTLTRLLGEMLQSLTGFSHPNLSTDAMERKLRGCLQKERYLIVLDDVWSTNKQVWDSIRSSLDRVTDGCTGSMVLVTTQSSEFASVVGDYRHEVKKLSNDDAWALFEGKAFDNKSPQQALDLRDVGERILRRCGGLPLAINTLASILASMNERSQWESVDRSWKLSEGQTKIMPWLLLSFIHLLTPAIKQCFAHCFVAIPKGLHVSEGWLISSWIAQGFILPETSDQDMMAIGRSYINFMLANGLLRSVYRGNERRIFMKNRIHDLAVYVSDYKYLTIRGPNDLHKASSGVEHVSIYGWNASNSQLNFPKGNTQSTLRTLICYNATISIDLVAQASFLRQLNLRSCGLKEIPSSIGGLKHLRILDLFDNPFEYLPETIGNLYHLHELGLERCHGLVELRQQVTKLLSLRVISTTKAVHIPKGMGKLTRLMQLPLVKLEAGDGSKITELRSLLHLRGRVTIEQLENVSSKEDAMEADLKIKDGITNLKLIWTPTGNTVCSNDEEVMEGLQPHSNLEGLEVWNFRGKRFSLWLSSGLCWEKLTFLVLLNCKRCEQLPTIGCLPNLKILRIEGMDSVEVIGSDFFYTRDQRVAAHSSTESGLFPQLKEFSLSNMLKLKEWFDPSGSCASAFPLLEVLVIANCPSLVSVPTCFHSLKQLTMKGINSGEPLLLILSNNYNLTSLTVENIQQLTCLSEPLMKCTLLRLLKITGCKELVELPPTLQSLSCLETLWVKDCDSLKSIPGIEGLLSLSELSIVRCKSITDAPCGLESCASIEHLCLVQCPELKFIPDLTSLSRLRHLDISSFSEQMMVPRWLNHLSNLSVLHIGEFSNELDNFCGIDRLPKCLKQLTLVGWPKLKSIPSELQSLTQLERLCLWGFEGVIALPEWLGSLSSLQVLDIRYCENMKQLPSPDAMRSLTQLREFRITDCTILEERFSKDGGEEWPKISHLPYIEINEIRVS